MHALYRVLLLETEAGIFMIFSSFFFLLIMINGDHGTGVWDFSLYFLFASSFIFLLIHPFFSPQSFKGVI